MSSHTAFRLDDDQLELIGEGLHAKRIQAKDWGNTKMVEALDRLIAFLGVGYDQQ